MNYPQILGVGTANPPIRLTQEQSFHAAGYETERIRKIFANSDIEYRHFHFEGSPSLQETSDQQNQRYLSRCNKNRLPRDFELRGISRHDREGRGLPGGLHVHRLRLPGCRQPPPVNMQGLLPQSHPQPANENPGIKP